MSDPGKLLQDQANIDLLRSRLDDWQIRAVFSEQRVKELERRVEAVREWAESVKEGHGPFATAHALYVLRLVNEEPPE